LQQRWEELLTDRHNLQWDHWNKKHPFYGSVKIHQEEFERGQQGLRNQLNKWERSKCGGPGDPPLIAEAEEWATRPTPSPIPRERPTPPAGNFSVSRVLRAMAVVGLSVGALAIVLAALADPEPVSKLALSGLSMVVITRLLTELGVQKGEPA
jgi:hypothetical protein